MLRWAGPQGAENSGSRYGGSRVLKSCIKEAGLYPAGGEGATGTLGAGD